MNRINKRGIGEQTSYRRSSRDRDEDRDQRDRSNDRDYAPYRHEHGQHRNDWNRNTHYGNDWNQSDNRTSERDEDWHRRTYGLPAGNRRMGQRHDIAQWGNPSFTQNTTNRQYDRIQDTQTRNARRRDESSNSSDNDFSYNRYYGGEVRSWEQRDNDHSWGDQSHRGKGPRGYSRSDERIREDISDRLTDDAHIDASDVDVAVEKGEVTLTGTVPDRWAKRRAEDIAELVSGVTNVENRIRVKTGKETVAGRDQQDHGNRFGTTSDQVN